MAAAAQALLVAERLAKACPSVMPTSLTVWWSSMWASPFAVDVEVEQAVADDLVEHVVEEGHAGVEPACPAIEVDTHGDLGFEGVA